MGAENTGESGNNWSNGLADDQLFQGAPAEREAPQNADANGGSGGSPLLHLSGKQYEKFVDWYVGLADNLPGNAEISANFNADAEKAAYMSLTVDDFYII